jgi:predicted pyridoxine 5'-phosphate oxidase superfamily flavin-nucleotide-binding protein
LDGFEAIEVRQIADPNLELEVYVPLLNETVRESARRSVLCWLATVDAEGQPNVSPKEVWAIADEEHVVVAHIASPLSARNIAKQPLVCLSFVDVFVQKGFKLKGTAQEVRASDPAFKRWAAPLLSMVGQRFAIQSVWVIRVTSVAAIVAPSYRFYPDETTEASQVASALRTYGVQP